MTIMTPFGPLKEWDKSKELSGEERERAVQAANWSKQNPGRIQERILADAVIRLVKQVERLEAEWS